MKLETKLIARFVFDNDKPSAEETIQLNALNAITERIAESLQFSFRSLIISMLSLKKEDPNA